MKTKLLLGVAAVFAAICIAHASLFTDPSLLVPRARVFNNAPSRSLVTVAAAANGFQLSATRDADVRYSVTITTVATIGGNCTGSVVLEICPTNSATASDWVQIAQMGQGQAFGVVVGISCTQTITGSLRGTVPAGNYMRLRSVTTAGTPTFVMTSGQEILL